LLNFFRKKKERGSIFRPDRPRPRIGVITQYAPRKGHTTLSKCIEFALGNTPEVFSIKKLSRLDKEMAWVKSFPVEAFLRHERVIKPGVPFLNWLKTQDILIIIERATPALLALCSQHKIKSVVVPMIDWLPKDPAERKEGLIKADKVITLTQQAYEILKGDGLDNISFIPASLYWPIPEKRPARKSRIFYFNIGVGGPLNRRNVPMVLKVFNRLLEKYKDARLIMKMVPKARKYVPDLGPLHPNIQVIEKSMTGDEMRELQRNADVSLFPSRFEGLGFPLLESLASGVPVIATNGAPMNEFIVHEKNGLLLECTHHGHFGGQDIWQLVEEDMERQVERLMDKNSQPLLDSLTSHTLDGIMTAQKSWQTVWQSHIAKLSPFVVNIGAAENPSPGACNVDLRQLPGIDLVASARMLPFADGIVDELIAEHLIEHFAKADTDAVLDEWIRVIKPGGKIRIQTADIRHLCAHFHKGKMSLDELNHWIYGGQDSPGNFHVASFDEERLRELLTKRGIRNIVRVTDSVSSKNLCLEGRLGAD
jgi:glycosyltransferase involved in cell wall biosynthesis